jgi:hypothetical protein
VECDKLRTKKPNEINVSQLSQLSQSKNAEPDANNLQRTERKAPTTHMSWHWRASWCLLHTLRTICRELAAIVSAPGARLTAGLVADHPEGGGRVKSLAHTSRKPNV